MTCTSELPVVLGEGPELKRWVVASAVTHDDLVASDLPPEDAVLTLLPAAGVGVVLEIGVTGLPLEAEVAIVLNRRRAAPYGCPRAEALSAGNVYAMPCNTATAIAFPTRCGREIPRTCFHGAEDRT